MKLANLGLLLVASTLMLGGCVNNGNNEDKKDDDGTVVLDMRTPEQVTLDLKEHLESKGYEVFISVGEATSLLIFFNENYTTESCLRELMGNMPSYLVIKEDIHEITLKDDSKGYDVTYYVKNGRVLVDAYSSYDKDDMMGPYSVMIDMKNL